MRKRTILSIGIIVLAIAVLLLSILDEPLYGNDPASIVQVIKSISLYEGKSVQLLEIYDIDEDRIVTFLSNGSPSIIEFYKDDQGNYTGPRSETRTGENLSHFVVGAIGQEDDVYVFSVKNQYAKIDEMTFRANAESYRVDFQAGHPNSHYIRLDPSEDNSYTFEWPRLQE